MQTIDSRARSYSQNFMLYEVSLFFDRFIGNLNTTCVWEIKNRVIEVTTTQGKKEEVGLLGVNGKTGEVFYMGADSEGSSSLGR